MKTHEHAIISLGFGAGVSLMLHGSLASDPMVYLAALAGGEGIDLLDHTLYHLVYRRDEPHVIAARQIFLQKGMAAFWRYVLAVEDRREFKHLLLHNVFALAVVCMASCLWLFGAGNLLALVGIGATLLHMLTDIACDWLVLGHCENWLWVLPLKWRHLRKTRRSSPQLAGLKK